MLLCASCKKRNAALSLYDMHQDDYIKHSLNHAAICVRVLSRPAAHSSPIGGQLDASAGENTVCAQSHQALGHKGTCVLCWLEVILPCWALSWYFSGLYPEVGYSFRNGIPDASGQPRVASAHVTSSFLRQCALLRRLHATTIKRSAFPAQQTLSSPRTLLRHCTASEHVTSPRVVLFRCNGHFCVSARFDAIFVWIV